jgi:chromosomal replication initiator protein
MAVRIESPDREMRRQIVIDKSVSRRMELSAEVMDFLADNLRSSISEIEGAINYLEHYAETFGRRLTLEGVRTALGDILRHSVPVLRVDELRERFCRLFQIQSKTLSVKKRVRSVSHPRMLVLYLARKYTSATYSEIGREIADLNHSSVIAAEKKILREISKDGEIVLGDRTWKVRDAIEAFERELGPR